MRKLDEIGDPNSYLNKATDEEYLFVLLGRDPAAPATIHFWIEERIRLGKNQPLDRQLIDAEGTAQSMELL